MPKYRWIYDWQSVLGFFRHLKCTQLVECSRASPVLVYREVDIGVPEALERLSQAVHTAFTNPPDMLEIQFDSNDFTPA